jgi:hypothetical protein
MTNGAGRYGSGSSSKPQSSSTDAVLAAIENELKNQGRQLKTMNLKVDSVSETVTRMNTQMEHLVTKEACAEGRQQLGDDLKRRMDGDREITGTNIKIPALWQQFQEATKQKKTTVPPPPAPQQKPQRGFLFWLGVIAACVTISGGIVGVTFAAYKVLDVIQATEQMMQDMQRHQSSNQ